MWNAANWFCSHWTRTRARTRCERAWPNGSGVSVAVVVTDTMGRAWRNGQVDAAIGASGLAVLHAFAGAIDGQGNELLVTEVAVADELAAAADLVKGKLSGVPVAVVRGLPVRPNGSSAADLVRPTDQDLFRLGTAEALAQGRAGKRCCCAAPCANSPPPRCHRNWCVRPSPRA